MIFAEVGTALSPAVNVKATASSPLPGVTANAPMKPVAGSLPSLRKRVEQASNNPIWANMRRCYALEGDGGTIY